MNEEQIDLVRFIVANALKKELYLVTLATSAESEEGWDSLAQIDILEGLESEFNILISDDELIDLISVASIVTLVESKIDE